jgi:hypothetical protein
MILGKPLFHHTNHPIKWVRLTGVIVAADERAGKCIYTLDDSSGVVIECVAVALEKVKTDIPLEGKMGQNGSGVQKHLDSLARLQAKVEKASEGKQNGNKEKADKIVPSVQTPIL